MEKNAYRCRAFRASLARKMVLYMKLSALFLLLALQVSATNYAQEKIILNAKSISVAEVLKAIERQTSYTFSYSNDVLPSEKLISIRVKNADINKVMVKLFEDIPLKWNIIKGKHVVLSPVTAIATVNLGDMMRTVRGTVRNENGEPVVGASVIVKGGTAGTVTGADGTFSINAPENAILEITAIGYTPIEVKVEGTAPLAIVMQKRIDDMEKVVVTALGITKQAKTLTYTTQSVDGAELTTVKSTNVLNSLNGKVAGVQINRTSGGAGGSVKVVLRGDKSTRNSQPLYVIDGLPIINQSNGPDAGLYNGGPDNGDIMSTLNPDDIESINFLKGASASALYGSQGSNGVVLIQTKKGKAGTAKLDFTSSITFDNVSILPKLQNTYAQTKAPAGAEAGSEDSWGAKAASIYDNSYVKKFFQTGVTFINSINLSAGTEKSSSYFSYSNTDNKGVIPTSTLKQHTVSFRQNSKFFNDKLIFDGTFMGSIQNSNNRLTPGIYFNPLTGLYLLPRGLNFDNYKNFEYYSNLSAQSRNLYAQNWWNINYDKGWTGQDYQQNPYWILNRNAITNKNTNVYASASFKYLLNSWLSIQARGNINKFDNSSERKIYATTQGTLTFYNGRYVANRSSLTTLYGDLILLGDKKINDNIGLTFTVGTSIQDNRQTSNYIAGQPKLVNVLQESGLEASPSTLNMTQGAPRKQIQSVFGSVQLSFKDKIFLDLADRNDWSSTLAFTPSMKKGYNYYSIGASALLHELFTLPEVINFAKLRASYAQVGNDIDPFSTYPIYSLSNGGYTNPPGSRVTTDFGLGLKPEINKSFEVGAQINLFKSRLLIDATWYKSNVFNQFFHAINLPGVTLSTSIDANAGNIQNKGVELSVTYKVFNNENFKWASTVNFSHNKNKVIALFDNSKPENIYKLNGGGGYSGLQLNGSFGDLFGRNFKRDDQGRLIVSSKDHMPQYNDNGYIGNPSPKAIVGWNNVFDYKNFRVGFLIDGKFGGQVLSITQGYLDQMGVSQRSADVRDNGGKITITNAVDDKGAAWNGTIDAKDYYKSIGGKTPAGEEYVYDATAIRLREFSLSYHLPIKRVIKDIRFGIIGNNLFFFKRSAPFDPEQVSGVNAGGLGIDAFGLPAYRSIGVSLKCSF